MLAYRKATQKTAVKRFLVPNYPPAIFSVQENQASEKKRSLLHFPKSSLRLQIGINTVHASCSFSPSYRQTDLKASHALFPLSEMKAVQIGDFVCGGGAIGERGVCLCFPRYRCNSWASGKKKERQKKKKNRCLKAPSFTVQLDPAQLFQIKELFSSELFQAQQHMGASLLFF